MPTDPTRPFDEQDHAAARGISWTAELLDQLDGHGIHQLRLRLDGLTDAEYLWEPVAGCWNLRPRAYCRAAIATCEQPVSGWTTFARSRPPRHSGTFNLEPRPDEECGHRVAVCDGDPNMIEASYVDTGYILLCSFGIGPQGRRWRGHDLIGGRVPARAGHEHEGLQGRRQWPITLRAPRRLRSRRVSPCRPTRTSVSRLGQAMSASCCSAG